jgi:hypothetical protein
MILGRIPIWNIKDHTHNYDSFKQMANIAKAFIATHQPQIEHKIEKIDTTSLSNAIRIIHQFPQKYRFKNNWIFDVERRLYIFSYKNRKIILKQGNINKLQKEMELTSKVNQLIDKVKIGEKRVKVIIPKLYKINSRKGYLSSEYF